MAAGTHPEPLVMAVTPSCRRCSSLSLQTAMERLIGRRNLTHNPDCNDAYNEVKWMCLQHVVVFNDYAV